MKNLIKKENFIILITLLIYAFSTASVMRFLYPIKYDKLNLFFSELLSKPFSMPFPLIFFSALGSIIFLILIARKLFGKNYLITLFIYCISPWSLYLVAAQSFYVFLTFLLLVFSYSIFLIKDNRRIIGSLLFVAAVVLISYSSFLLFFILPLLTLGLLVTEYVSIGEIKNNLIISFIFIIPLVFLILHNKVGFENIARNQIKLFDGPGLINNINLFAGESSEEGLSFFSKVAENKYIYFSKYIFLKFTTNIIPATFFTPQEKLLNFSFTPPIYIGFLLPFLYGLYALFKSAKLRKYLLLFIILVIPSFLSESFADLNRLLIVEPVIIFIITYGLISFREDRKSLLSKALLSFIILFVFIQYLATFADISFREHSRYQRVYGSSLEIGQQ